MNYNEDAQTKEAEKIEAAENLRRGYFLVFAIAALLIIIFIILNYFIGFELSKLIIVALFAAMIVALLFLEFKFGRKTF